MKNIVFLACGMMALPQAAVCAAPASAQCDPLVAFHLSNSGKTVRRLPVDVVPENVFWWFTTRDFADGMKTFSRLVDEGLAGSTYNCVTLSLRCNSEFGGHEVQEAARVFFAKTRAAGVKAYMDTDPRIARCEFLSRWPDEKQGVAHVVAATPTNGCVAFSYEFKDAEDHMTSGAAVSYRPLKVYEPIAFAAKRRPDGSIDLSRRRRVEAGQKVSFKEWYVPESDGHGRIERATAFVDVCAQGLSCDEVLVAVLRAEYHCIDVFSPNLLPFARELMERCKALGADGAMHDEWGFMPDYLPDLHTFWWSENMAKAYRKFFGCDLVDDYPLMALGAKGDADRSKAIGAFMKLVLDRNVEIELDFYDADKMLFGDDVYVVKHPTWHCWICPQEYFHNGLNWWQAKRDWAQGDEVTPFYVLNALSKKWGSPVWLNEGYSATQAKNTFRHWSYAMCGGRQVYHCLYSGNPREMEPYERMAWEERRVRLSTDLMASGGLAAQSRVRLLNLITRAPVDSPVAFVFGHEKLVDWNSDGWNDHGAKQIGGLLADGWWCDAYPASECALGTFAVDGDGYLRVGRQRYHAVMLHQLSDAERKAFEAAVSGSVLKTRVFAADEGDAVKRHLLAIGAVRQPCAKGRTRAGATYPEPDGTLRLIDGTAVRIRAGWDSPCGLPISEPLESAGMRVSVEAEGVAAVRCEGGEVVAVCGGALTRVEGPGLSLKLATPQDVALVKIGGVWRGVWQTPEATMPVPKELAALTEHWVRLLVPVRN